MQRHRGRLTRSNMASNDSVPVTAHSSPNQPPMSYRHHRGMLPTKGVCPDAVKGAAPACVRLPVIAGEVAGAPGDSRDSEWLNATATYLSATPPATKSGASLPVGGWFWCAGGVCSFVFGGTACGRRWGQQRLVLVWLQLAVSAHRSHTHDSFPTGPHTTVWTAQDEASWAAMAHWTSPY